MCMAHLGHHKILFFWLETQFSCQGFLSTVRKLVAWPLDESVSVRAFLWFSLFWFSRKIMTASYSIKTFSRVDICFFKSSTFKEELSLQFEILSSDKPIIAFSSSSNFFSTDLEKPLIPSNSFIKIFWKEVKLCGVSLRGLLGVCAISSDMSEAFWWYGKTRVTSWKLKSISWN